MPNLDMLLAAARYLEDLNEKSLARSAKTKYQGSPKLESTWVLPVHGDLAHPIWYADNKAPLIRRQVLAHLISSSSRWVSSGQLAATLNLPTQTVSNAFSWNRMAGVTRSTTAKPCVERRLVNSRVQFRYLP